jgi:phospholipase A1
MPRPAMATSQPVHLEAGTLAGFRCGRGRDGAPIGTMSGDTATVASPKPASGEIRMRTNASWLFAIMLLMAGNRALAQSSPAAEACASIEADADRLACYDTAFGRTHRDTRQADLAAQDAERLRAAQQSVPITAPADASVASDLYREDDPIARALANAGKGSLLDSRWELARDSKLGTFNFRAYKPVYLMPVFWSSAPNGTPSSSNPDVPAATQSLRSVETKFQVSFKTKAFEDLFGDNGDIWMGYTQVSHWQVYNGADSRPFRETNYEPEVLLVFRNNYTIGGWHGRMFGIGVNHQSNGRADPLSRSWNRVMVNIGLDRDGWAVVARPWWRISDGNADENPGIEDYIGRGDVTLVHQVGDNELSLMARHSLRGGDRSRGALQFEWGFPISRTLRGHLQVFDGYGESLIDYNHRATYVGLGISLLEWY